MPFVDIVPHPRFSYFKRDPIRVTKLALHFSLLAPERPACRPACSLWTSFSMSFCMNSNAFRCSRRRGHDLPTGLCVLFADPFPSSGIPSVREAASTAAASALMRFGFSLGANAPAGPHALRGLRAQLRRRHGACRGQVRSVSESSRGRFFYRPWGFLNSYARSDACVF
jgi:hypothetical protein